MEKLLILDSNSILHRAFHALPPLTTKKGEIVNALYGFLLVLFKAIREIQPNFICACFDFPAKTFRHEKFKEYKAKRPPIPKDLIFQIEKTKEALNLLSIPFFEKEGFEADDLISTISKLAKDKVSKIFILSGDFDILQLIDKKTRVYILGRGIKKSTIFEREKVFEKFGVFPEQLPDFKALVGDPSDNIPGIPGIGKKRAAEILRKYESLENLYDKIKRERMEKEIRETLIKNKEKVLLSKDLIKLRSDLEIDFDLEKCQFGKFDQKKFEEFLKKYQFSSLLKRVSEIVKGEKMKRLF